MSRLTWIPAVLVLVGALPVSGQSPWKAIGPEGGAVHALAAGPDAVLYAGTDGGVYRSEDGGRHWRSASQGLGNAHVRALTAGRRPQDPVYAGTDGGLFRSLDEGMTWTAVESGPSVRRIIAVGIDPLRSDSILAGTAMDGLWRSSDGGVHWIRELPDLSIDGIVLDRGSPPSAFVIAGGLLFRQDGHGGWSRLATPPSPLRFLLAEPASSAGLYAGTDGGGLIRSFDGGQSWKPTGLRAALITCVAIEAGAPARIYAGGLDGVFVSSEGGEQWTLDRVGPVLALAAAGGNQPALIAATPSGILRRDLGGKHWSESNAGLYASHVFTAAAEPGATASLLAGTNRGLQRAVGVEARWNPLSVGSRTVFALAIPSPSRALWGASGALGSGSLSDDSWALVQTPAAFAVTADPFEKDTYLAATASSILRSTDGGAHWVAASRDFPKAVLLSLAADPKHKGVFYVGTAGSGIFKTKDSGALWEPVSRNLQRFAVRCLVADPIRRNTVYAGTDGGVFISTNGGSRWEFQPVGQPRASVQVLTLDPKSGSLYAGTNQGVFESSDGGRGWAILAGAPALPVVTSIAVDDNSNRLLIGTQGAGVLVVSLSPAERARTGQVPGH